MDAAERALLEATVLDAVTNATVDSGGGAIDDTLTELGWLEMLDAELRDAVEIVFTALGVNNAVATVLDDVIVSALGLTPRADLAVLLPAFATWAAPAGIGLTTGRVGTAAELVVVGESWIATVPATAVDASPVHGIDPTGGWHAVRVDVGDAARSSVDDGAWASAVAAGQRAVGHQIAGESRAMLDLARTHALERVQFGRAVAQFQAVRHRLAEALVAIEALEASLTAAWDEGSPMTAALAKAVAGRTGRTVAAQCQQVLAGIGFTTDHPFHRYLKRTMALEGLFGSADEIVVDLGRQLLSTRQVPTLIEL